MSEEELRELMEEGPLVEQAFKEAYVYVESLYRRDPGLLVRSRDVEELFLVRKLGDPMDAGW
jgi:hypothetical protein